MDWDQLVGAVGGKKEGIWSQVSVTCSLLASRASLSYCLFAYLILSSVI